MYTCIYLKNEMKIQTILKIIGNTIYIQGKILFSILGNIFNWTFNQKHVQQNLRSY